MRVSRNRLLMEQEKIDMTPMIDVVFQLIIFFLVTTTKVQEEADLIIPLPSKSPAVQQQDLPPEYTIGIGESGQVYLDEQPVDAPEDLRLPELASRLQGLRDSAPGGDMIITIAPDDNSSHIRTINVLNVLASLKISKINFVGGAAD